MSSSTPNLNLVLPVGGEHVSRAIINENNTKIDMGFGTLSEQIQHYYDTDGKLYRLPSNADLGSITESGRYYFGSNVTNKPASGGGYLDVYAYDTSWIKQVAYLEGSYAIYVRTKTGSSWSAWQQLAPIEMFDIEISNGQDLDSLTKEGMYGCATGSAAQTLVHCPVTANFTMLNMRKGNLLNQIIFSGGNIYVRSGTSSGFGNWFKHTGTDTGA